MAVELVVPYWREGNEKGFADFITSSQDAKKIALISHTDLDGLTSAKVISAVLPPDYIRFVGYNEINLEIVKELVAQKVTHVVFSDLLIENPEVTKELEKSARILIIDHHVLKYKLGSAKTTFLNAEGFCAAYLSYYLFSKVQDISKLDWLVACACLGDWCWRSPGQWLEGVFRKYDERFVADNKEVKKGKFWEVVEVISKGLIFYYADLKKAYSLIGNSFDELQGLEKASLAVQAEIDRCKNDFEKKKVPIKDGWFYEAKSEYPVKSYIINEVSLDRYPNKTILLGSDRSEGGYYSISARRQDSKFNLAEYLAKTVEGLDGASGGGHPKAAGALFLPKDKAE